MKTFWDKIDKSEDCWLWMGSKSKGYGRIWVEGKQTGAHQYSYMLHHGPIPAGLCVCHSCDTRDCVNPDHLFLGTHKDNMDDMRRKGRGHWHSGEAHQGSRLTDEDVRWIRYIACAQKKIAKCFGISETHVSDIKNMRARVHA